MWDISQNGGVDIWFMRFYFRANFEKVHTFDRFWALLPLKRPKTKKWLRSLNFGRNSAIFWKRSLRSNRSNRPKTYQNNKVVWDNFVIWNTLVDSLDSRSSGDKTQHSMTRFAPKDDESADTSDTWIWCWICWSIPHKAREWIWIMSIYSFITFLTCNVYLGFEIWKLIFLPVVDTEGCHLNAIAETRATFGSTLIL